MLPKALQIAEAAFDNLHAKCKLIIKYGATISLTILAIGALLIFLNHFVLTYSIHLEFIARSVVNVSFQLLAEAVIGALAIDFILGRKQG